MNEALTSRRLMQNGTSATGQHWPAPRIGVRIAPRAGRREKDGLHWGVYGRGFT
jgi:hypothetical protein